MKKELFLPYKEMIVRCIESCKHQDQLTVCSDMMYRFNETFSYSIETKLRAEAMDELSNRWLQKSAELAC